MENSSDEIIFVLNGLNDTMKNKHIIFVFTLLIYLFTLFANLTLIVLILLEEVLHAPMFIFLCNLCIHGICGATGFYPKFLIDLLSDSQTVTYRACITQMFVIYIYVFLQLTNLTVMAYDRYVAICRPLEYHSIMTPQKICKLSLIIWLFPFCEASIGLILTARLPLCGTRIDKLYCTNWEVVRLSCIDTTLNNLYGYVITCFQTVQAIVIVISYICIIQTCVRSREEHSKFMETCLPHLITLINFILSVVFDVMYARYGSTSTLHALRHILSVDYLIVPPLLNPLIYGLKLKQIRRSLWRICSSKSIH